MHTSLFSIANRATLKTVELPGAELILDSTSSLKRLKFFHSENRDVMNCKSIFCA